MKTLSRQIPMTMNTHSRFPSHCLTAEIAGKKDREIGPFAFLDQLGQNHDANEEHKCEEKQAQCATKHNPPGSFLVLHVTGEVPRILHGEN
jgi:hypothetical protein